MWSTQMPMGLIRRCRDWLPRLRAEESLRHANAVALGSGRLKRGDARDLQRRWQREAEPVAAGPRRRLTSLPEGIGVRIVPRKRKQA